MKKKIVTIVGWTISIVLIVSILTRVDLHAMWSSFTNAKWSYLALAAVINLAVVVMKAWRMVLLASPICRVNFKNAVLATFIGFACSNVFPVRGGEILKIHLIGKWENASRTSIASVAGLDKIFEGAALLILFGILSFHSTFPEWVEKGILITSLALVFFLIVSLILLLHSRREEKENGGRIARFTKKLGEGVAAIADLKIAVVTLILSLVICTTQVATIWCCQKAFGLTLPIWMPVLVFVAINFAIVVPSAPSSIGPFEAGAMLAYSWLKVSSWIAFNVAIMYHAVQFFPVTLIGAAMYIWITRTGNPLRRALFKISD